MVYLLLRGPSSQVSMGWQTALEGIIYNGGRHYWAGFPYEVLMRHEKISMDNALCCIPIAWTLNVPN